MISHLLANKTPDASAANVSVLQFSGTEDTLVPYNGGSGVLGHDFLPAEKSTEQWAIHNGCDATAAIGQAVQGPQVETAPGVFNSSSYTMSEWENGTSGTQVIHVKMSGGSDAYIDDFLVKACQ